MRQILYQFIISAIKTKQKHFQVYLICVMRKLIAFFFSSSKSSLTNDEIPFRKLIIIYTVLDYLSAASFLNLYILYRLFHFKDMYLVCYLVLKLSRMVFTV